MAAEKRVVVDGWGNAVCRRFSAIMEDKCVAAANDTLHIVIPPGKVTLSERLDSGLLVAEGDAWGAVALLVNADVTVKRLIEFDGSGNLLQPIEVEIQFHLSGGEEAQAEDITGSLRIILFSCNHRFS
jgi:hypothetical protein